MADFQINNAIDASKVTIDDATGVLTQKVVNNVDPTRVKLKTNDTYVTDDIVVHMPINVNLKAGALNNAATTGVTYTENEAGNTVIPAEGSLYINAGWYPNTKITLGHMIPDDTEYDNAGVGHILEGYEAYDTNGKKLIGTLATADPTFKGGEVTVTPEAALANNASPKVTINPSGTFLGKTAYGVTTSKPTGTDGTNYLSIDAAGTPTGATVNVTTKYSRDDVEYKQSLANYVNKAADDVAYAGVENQAGGTTTLAVTPTVDDKFSAQYIPITEPTFNGGAVTTSVTNQTTQSGSVTISASGTIATMTTANKTACGIVSAKPSGKDGTDYFSIDGTYSKQDTELKVTGHSVITDVTMTQNAGATTAKNNTKIIDFEDEYTKDSTITVDPNVTDNFSTIYIKHASVSHSGGVLTATAGANITTNPKVTINQSGSATTTTAGTNYGITTTAPAGTDGTSYLTVTSSGEGKEGGGTASATASGTDVTCTVSQGGIIKTSDGSTKTLDGATDDYIFTIIPVVTADKNLYIPIVTKSAEVSKHTVTNPTVTPEIVLDGTGGADYSGITTTEPTSGSYITIMPAVSTTAGTSTAQAKATSGKGLITNTMVTSDNDEKTIGVSKRDGVSYYIKVYDGSYVIG